MSQIDYGRILRLKDAGLSNRKIASSAGCSRDTVARVLKAARKKGVTGIIAGSMTNDELEQELFPGHGYRGDHAQPNYSLVHAELAKRGVTLSLLHDEYCEDCAAMCVQPYSRSQFNLKYHDWAKHRKVTMRVVHKPGEVMEADWAGDTLDIVDSVTGKPLRAHFFVGCLPFSQIIYTEPFPNEKLESWIPAHVNAFEYYGGVPDVLVPDNLKAGILSHPTPSQFKVNPAYQEMADYYGINIIPARVRTPKDKASVERAVRIVETRILGALRNSTFFSFEELRKAVREQLDILNSRPFQRRPGSRIECFRSEEKPFLRPLPAEPYENPTWEVVKVPPEYLITAGGRKYSVPYEYVGQTVRVRLTSGSVDVFFKDLRIASHTRIQPGYEPVYNPEHMPGSHKAAAKMNDPSAYFDWAAGIGKSTEQTVHAFFDDQSRKHAVLRSRQLMKLADRFSVSRLEKACQKALSVCENPEVDLIESILTNETDKTVKGEDKVPQPKASGIIRGAEYYRRKKS